VLRYVNGQKYGEMRWWRVHCVVTVGADLQCSCPSASSSPHPFAHPTNVHTPLHNNPKSEAHYDYFFDALNKAPEVGGQRVITALMYLSTPEQGGETVFPLSETQSPRDGMSDCVKRGLANKPQKGDLIMFYALRPDGTEDETSLHESCPTLKGVSGGLLGGVLGGSAAD